MVINTNCIQVMILLAASACASSPPAKAPGTNPGDMSADEHKEKAAQHEQMAAEHQEQADSVGVTGRTPLTEEQTKKMHQDKADQEKDVAKQHSDAADKASKP